IYDQDNMWALMDSQNYAQGTKQYWQTLQKHYQYFWQHNIPVDIISPQTDLSAYKLIIDPMHFLMSTAFMTKLDQYIKSGGVVVGTYISGIVNELGLAYLGGWPQMLQQLYGVQIEETDTLYPKQTNQIFFEGQSYLVKDYCTRINSTGAKVLATYKKDFYADTPAVTENHYGKGQTYYLACRTDLDFLTTFYDKLTSRFKLAETLPLQADSSDVSIQIRENKQTTYIFVLNFDESEHMLTLSLPLVNMLTNQKEQGEVRLESYGIRVYQINK
ncbi:MAG TPA: beta-galactosidase trimerization domain-containing protein, partial [Lapidilactobacillus dextrinicus]|nr:beta-galactosidase trimerization domain-containing protein [Lapidilactobacillus dextrinicus]